MKRTIEKTTRGGPGRLTSVYSPPTKLSSLPQQIATSNDRAVRSGMSVGGYKGGIGRVKVVQGALPEKGKRGRY